MTAPTDKTDALMALADRIADRANRYFGRIGMGDELRMGFNADAHELRALAAQAPAAVTGDGETVEAELLRMRASLPRRKADYQDGDMVKPAHARAMHARLDALTAAIAALSRPAADSEAVVDAGEACPEDATNREIVEWFLRACREAKPVGQWPNEVVCKAIEQCINGPRDFIAPEAVAELRAPVRGEGGPGWGRTIRQLQSAAPTAPAVDEAGPITIRIKTTKGGDSSRPVTYYEVPATPVGKWFAIHPDMVFDPEGKTTQLDGDFVVSHLVSGMNVARSPYLESATAAASALAALPVDWQSLKTPLHAKKISADLRAQIDVIRAAAIVGGDIFTGDEDVAALAKQAAQAEEG